MISENPGWYWDPRKCGRTNMSNLPFSGLIGQTPVYTSIARAISEHQKPSLASTTTQLILIPSTTAGRPVSLAVSVQVLLLCSFVA